MDEADCYSFQRGSVEEKRTLLLPGHGQDEGYYERVKNKKESLTHCNHNHLESSQPVSGEINIKPFDTGLSSSLPSLASTTANEAPGSWSSPKCIQNEGYCKSPSMRGDESFQHHVKSRMETPCEDVKKGFDQEDKTQLCDTAISSSDCKSYYQDHCNNMPSSIGTDETDQGQVVPNFSLTEQLSEYPVALSNSQYYPKPKDSAVLDLIPDSTIKESPGFGLHQTAVCRPSMGHEESLCAIRHQCSAPTTMQGQLVTVSKSSVSSNTPVEVEGGEVSKRKTSCDERLEDHRSEVKRQKISSSIQQEVQYNQTVLSTPKQYQVSGNGNYIFDSLKNCTFNVYKGGPDSVSQKQHALQWGSRQSSQTDSVTGTIPTESLQTIAKLIAQTTEWKKIARLLPMTECPTLEADIKALEECEGTTCDKTLAVLMRWWREHPKQGDRTTMKECLQRGLECCKLVRLARTIDNYFPDAKCP